MDEVRSRLQARVPGFRLSPDPGGQWDWLLGAIALGAASGMLVLLTRRAVARGNPTLPMPGVMSISDHDEEMRWQDRLDDELMNSEV